MYNPQLSVEAEHTDIDTTSVSIDQTFDWSGKRTARSDAASSELAAVEAEYHALRQRVAGDLLAALTQYHSAAAVVELAQRRGELMRHFLDVAERRHRAGDLGQIDLDLARLAATQAQLRSARAAADAAAAERAIVELTGERAAQWPALPLDLPAIVELDEENLLAGLPAVRAQYARVASARAVVDLRRRERQPDPTLGVRGGREGTEDLIGITISIPLFVRNRFDAEVDAADAELVQAESRARDLERRARARLRSAAERYRVAHAAWAAWQRTGQSSLESQTVLLERIWRAGELSTSDYLVQLQQTLDTRADALAVRATSWEAWFDWLIAAGRVDDWLNGGLG